ncbi:MAG: class I SAM-dependent methyltransferase [Candidatus Omnitrophota bacterium]
MLNEMKTKTISISNLFLWLHYWLQYLVIPIRKHECFIKNIVNKYARDQRVKVLDFGCGEGVFSKLFLRMANVDYVGYDKNYVCLQFARKFAKDSKFVLGNEQLCIPGEVFDFVLLHNVMHHMNDREVCVLVSELKRILKQGAFVIVVELTIRKNQKGLFFRFVTFWEERLKKIRYCGDSFFSKFFAPHFEEIYSEKISANFLFRLFKISGGSQEISKN